MSQRDEEPMLNQALTETLLEAVKPVTPPPGLRAKILARIRSEGHSKAGQTVRNLDGWREIAPGIQYKMLFVDEIAQSKSFLLRAAAGSRLPAHGHHGFEECLVLEGSFSFGDLTLRAGDFHLASEQNEHPESYTDAGVLVYLRASLRDYPMVVA